ncbi:hypothetical protein C6P44_001845 [Monosporozyma unispora]|nr:hypothetical protein C6P44_001845 [Kazachstania unispora]
MDVNSLMKRSLQLQSEIKAIAQEMGELQQELEEDVTEFCNIDKTIVVMTGNKTNLLN